MNRGRIYLDHAATSWPKSPAVVEAVSEFMTACGAAAGRGAYRSANEAGQIVSETRRRLARLINASSPEQITLHANGTAALNTAIHGLLRPGDHVVSNAAEHNSVLRPLQFLQQHREIDLTIVPVDNNGKVDAAEIVDAVTQKTKLVTLLHASNVTGTIQPVSEVGRLLKNRPPFFLVDAAQTFGTLPLDVRGCHIDLLAAPGHKSSGGPLGTAMLYVGPSLSDQIVPLMQGGTGSQSESLEMPGRLPERLEPGNLNVAALAGWNAALGELMEQTVVVRQTNAERLAEQLHTGLRSIEHLQVYGIPGELPIASINVEGLSPSDVAMILDSQYDIETRSGLHCAALIHHHLGSQAEGTLRISAGETTLEEEIDAVIEALRAVVVAMSGR